MRKLAIIAFLSACLTPLLAFGGELQGGMLFFRTRDLAGVSAFYEREVGFTPWLEQPGVRILRFGNLLLGLHQEKECDTGALVSLFFSSRAAVDAAYAGLKARASAPPRENPTFRVYHFFASDPEGRLLEFQSFLDPVDWDLAPSPASRTPGQERLLDMTYPYDGRTIYWPTAEPFRLEKLGWGITPGGWWYASNNYAASEHGGTHADAPIHFAEGGRTIDQVPLREWIGPAVRIDATRQCARDRDHMLTVEEIRSWEAGHGSIPPGSWVLMYTGIGTRFYPDRKQVLGTEKSGPEALPELSFPGFSPEAAEFLVKERSIRGVGLDTPSIDRGKSKDFRVHRILFAAGKLALENIANLDKVPDTGAVLHVIPMMIKDGTGAPARVFALLPPAGDGN